MFHDLVHGDQIEAVIGKRQTFTNARGKHLVFKSALRNLNGTDPAALPDSIRLNAERAESSPAARQDKGAYAGTDIQHPRPRGRGPEIGDRSQNGFSIVAKDVLSNPFLPLRGLNALPVLLAVLQQESPQLRFTQLRGFLQRHSILLSRQDAVIGGKPVVDTGREPLQD